MGAHTTIPLHRLLDPRSTPAAAAAEPFAEAVNIPLDQIAARIYELPPPSDTVWIAACDPARDAAALLERLGRRTCIIPAEPCDADDRVRPRGRLWRPSNVVTHFLRDSARTVFRQSTAVKHSISALDLGCGVGRDAVYLAALGWRVSAIDHLPDALTRATNLARVHAVDPRNITWIQADVAAPLTPLKGERFDVVLASRLHLPNVIELSSNWVAPNGVLLLELLTRDHAQRCGKPVHPVDPAAARAALDGWRLLAFEVAQVADAEVLSVVAVRPG